MANPYAKNHGERQPDAGCLDARCSRRKMLPRKMPQCRTLRLALIRFICTPNIFTMRRTFGAIVRPASFDSRNGTVMEDDHALFSVEGKKFSGPEAMLKLKTCVLVMKPHYNHQIKGSKVTPKITMTVPKIVGRDNYHPADREQLREALRGCRRNWRRMALSATSEMLWSHVWTWREPFRPATRGPLMFRCYPS